MTKLIKGPVHPKLNEGTYIGTVEFFSGWRSARATRDVYILNEDEYVLGSESNRFPIKRRRHEGAGMNEDLWEGVLLLFEMHKDPSISPLMGAS